MERDECKSLIEKYSGRVTIAISGKTNYLIVGRDVSEGKLNKAREMKIKIISEDDLLEMIRTRPGDEENPSPTKLTKKSSSTNKKTTVKSEPEPSVIPKTSTDQSNLLCKYLFY